MNLIEQPEKISQHCLVSGAMLKDAKNGNKYVELTRITTVANTKSISKILHSQKMILTSLI